MKNLKLFLLGLFASVAFPFVVLIISSQMQLGALGRAPAEDGGPLFPSREPGLAIQGRAVYLQMGCVTCHTQQVRPAGMGSDIARGWGARPSVARDYVLQSQVLLGDLRYGPDLANVGVRLTEEQLHQHLRAPSSVVAGSVMPAYEYLYQAKGQGWEPTDRAVALVAYLKSLRQDYASPEAKLKQ
jgi:cytochrome c oxidase cbb3-type subunit 2